MAWLVRLLRRFAPGPRRSPTIITNCGPPWDGTEADQIARFIFEHPDVQSVYLTEGQPPQIERKDRD